MDAHFLLLERDIVKRIGGLFGGRIVVANQEAGPRNQNQGWQDRGIRQQTLRRPLSPAALFFLPAFLLLLTTQLVLLLRCLF